MQEIADTARESGEAVGITVDKGAEAGDKSDTKEVTEQSTNSVNSSSLSDLPDSSSTKVEESSKEIAEVLSEEYQNRARQNKVKRSKGKDLWFCADPGCKKENIRSSDSCQQCGLSAKMTKDYQGRRGGGRGGARGGGGGRGGGGWNRNQGDRRNKVVAIDTSDPVQNMFGQISKVLDARHDKRERIVKLSRDITIESKRIIFCLHRIKSEDDKAAVLGEAEGRLMEMKEKLWYYLARELKGEDHYQFIRAYSAGLQEWVEALSFYHYLTYDKLINFQEVEKELIFVDTKVKRKMAKGNDGENVDDGEEIDEKEVLPEEKSHSGKIETVVEVKETKIEEAEEALASSVDELSLTEEPNINILISVTVPQSEYILGLADLTGELMRNAINSLGSGNMDVCFTLLDILQNMSDGFNRLPKHEAPRDIGQKVYTLKQSCRKVENACYAISVRGSEIPKTHLADIFTQKRDEGHMEDGPGGEGDRYFSD